MRLAYRVNYAGAVCRAGGAAKIAAEYQPKFTKNEYLDESEQNLMKGRIVR